MLRKCFMCEDLIGCYVITESGYKQYNCNDKTNCTPTKQCEQITPVSHGLCEECYRQMEEESEVMQTMFPFPEREQDVQDEKILHLKRR